MNSTARRPKSDLNQMGTERTRSRRKAMNNYLQRATSHRGGFTPPERCDSVSGSGERGRTITVLLSCGRNQRRVQMRKLLALPMLASMLLAQVMPELVVSVGHSRAPTHAAFIGSR